MAVVDVYIDTMSELAARQFVCAELGLSERQARRYVKAAVALLTVSDKRLAANARMSIRAKAARLATQATAAGQFGAAVSAVALLAKVAGCDQPEVAAVAAVPATQGTGDPWAQDADE